MTTNEPRIDIYGLVKPRMRGVIHKWAVLPFVIAAFILVAFSPNGAARTSVVVYALAITGLLTSSAIYHRSQVSQEMALLLRRIDHSMIGVAIAGTYTPVVVVLMSGIAQTVLLCILWSGALASVLVAVLWPKAPRWLRASIYVGLGWAGFAVFPTVWNDAGALVFMLVVAGGASYTAGAVVYARRKPNPVPTVFGFHEVFHSLVLLAITFHFSAVMVLISRVA